MSTTPVQPIPAGMHTITPHLICAGAADAIAFYQRAFGAEELTRMPAASGKLLHASLRIGDSMVMLSDEFPDFGGFGPNSLKGSPVTIHLQVEDADKWYSRAVEAGASVSMAIGDQFWGDRYGQLTDPFGHTWSIGATLKK